MSIKNLIFETPYREPQKPSGRNLDVEIFLSNMIEIISNAQQEWQIFTEIESKLKSDYVSQSFRKVFYHLDKLYQNNVSIPLKIKRIDKKSVLDKITHRENDLEYYQQGLENRLFQLIEHITKILKEFKIMSADNFELRNEDLEKEITLLIRFMKNKRTDIISDWY